MNKIICILSFISFVHSSSFVANNVYDIGNNHEKIRKVFQECSALNVLLRSYEQPEGVINWLDNIFGNGGISFVVLNFWNASDHESFLEQCKLYNTNTSFRLAYHEQAFKKKYSSYGDMKGFEVYDNEFNVSPLSKTSETSVVLTYEEIKESFAEILDKWRTFRHEGSILFVSLENLEHYVGCLGSRSGTFLFIIISQTNDDKKEIKMVEKVFEKAWKLFANFKLFILVNQQIFSYNPYKRVNNSFGSIKVFKTLYTDDNLKHINGYPLNVELFYSVFSATNGKDESDIKSFKGPDVNVTLMIAQLLNSTCNNLRFFCPILLIFFSFHFYQKIYANTGVMFGVVKLIKNNGKFGVKLSNGTLTGALGNLQSRRSDIVTTAFFMKVL